MYDLSARNAKPQSGIHWHFSVIFYPRAPLSLSATYLWSRLGIINCRRWCMIAKVRFDAITVRCNNTQTSQAQPKDSLCNWNHLYLVSYAYIRYSYEQVILLDWCNPLLSAVLIVIGDTTIISILLLIRSKLQIPSTN